MYEAGGTAASMDVAHPAESPASIMYVRTGVRRSAIVSEVLDQVLESRPLDAEISEVEDCASETYRGAFARVVITEAQGIEGSARILAGESYISDPCLRGVLESVDDCRVQGLRSLFREFVGFGVAWLVGLAHE